MKPVVQYNQNNDFQFPTALSDSISTLSVNGSAQTPSSILIAGTWLISSLSHHISIYSSYSYVS